jgi:hypothetical protein
MDDVDILAHEQFLHVPEEQSESASMQPLKDKLAANGGGARWRRGYPITKTIRAIRK